MAEVGAKLKAILELDATQFQKQIDKCGEEIQKLGEKGVSSEGAEKIFAELLKGFSQYNTKIGTTVQTMVGNLEKSTKEKLSKVTESSKKQIEELESQISNLKSPGQDATTFDKWASGIKKITEAYKNLATVEQKEHQQAIAELKLELADEKARHAVEIENATKELAAEKSLADIKYKNAQAELMNAKAIAQANQAALLEAKKLNQESLIQTREANLEYKKQRDIIKDNEKAAKEKAKAEEKAQKELREQMEKTAETRKKLIKAVLSPIKVFSAAVVVLNQFKELLASAFRAMKTLWDYTYGQIIKINAEMENFMVRLKVVSGSESSAQSIFKNTVDYAKTVTFTLRESMESATALLPVLAGGKEELKKWLPVIGDISATFGLTFQEATANFIKAYSAGIAAADLFRERGITAAMGFTPGQTYSVKETREGMLTAWQDVGSVFRGASEELSSTWNGIVSKLEDRWNIFVQYIGRSGIFSRLKEELSNLLDAFDYLYENVEKNGKTSLENIAEMISKKLVEIFNNIVEMVNKFIDLLPDSFAESLFKTEEEKKAEERIANISARLDELLSQKDYSFGGLTEKLFGDKDSIAKREAEIKQLREELQKIYDDQNNQKSVSQSIQEKIEEAKRIQQIFARTPESSDMRSYFKEQAKEEKKLASIQRKMQGVIIDAQQETAKVANEYITKALKSTDGEWAATLNSIEGKVNKFAAKMKKKWEAQNFVLDPDIEGNVFDKYQQQIETFRKTLTDAESKTQAGNLFKSLKNAQEELKSVGMPEYQKQYNQILYDYAIKLKDANDKNKYIVQQEKEIKIAILNKTKALKDNITAMQNLATIEQDRYSRYEQYSARIAAIQSQRQIDTQQYGAQTAIDNYTASMNALKSNIDKTASESLIDVNIELQKIGMNAAEVAKIDLENSFKLWNDALKVVGEDSNAGQKIQELIDKMKELNEQAHPEGFVNGWKAGLADFRSSLKTTGDAAKELSAQIASDMSDALADGFFDVLSGEFEDLSDVFEDFAESVVKAMLQIQTQKMAAATMDGITSIVGSFFHGGGIVGQDSPTFTRKVNPMIFNGAPRFHNGLMPDEFPAILQKGEMVIPKDMVGSSSSNQKQSSNINITIHNESGDELQIKRTESQQDMSNIILDVWIDGYTRNRNGLRTMLGG